MSDSPKPIELDAIDGFALLRFCRPGARNPLSVETQMALSAALDDLRSERGRKGVILAGSGGTFAAGADIREVARLNTRSAREFGKRGQDLMLKIRRFPVPVIAAIEGFCLGGGLDLALACASRIASPDSQFAHPGPKLGIITGWGGTQMLPRLIGRQQAYGMLLTGRRVGAEEALRIGLIDAISDSPVETAVSIGREYAE